MIPEENDTIGFLDDEGEPLDFLTQVSILEKSFVSELGFLVFEILTVDNERMIIVKSNCDEFPFADWIEFLS